MGGDIQEDMTIMFLKISSEENDSECGPTALRGITVYVHHC